jgi:galactokinase/mevalonate kinase-like predicted kinase
MAVTPPKGRASEATAACRVVLAGEVLAWVARDARPAGALRVAAAVDRRPFARVEATYGGVRFESKDTLLRVEVGSVDELAKEGAPALVRRVLEALGISSGIRIATQARVPFEAGLGSASALAVAIGAAAASAFGRELTPASLCALAECAADFEPAAAASGPSAVWGSVVATPLEGIRASPVPGEASNGAIPLGAARLRVDPSRVEECLLLVDVSSGPGTSPSSVVIPGAAEPEPAGLAEIAAIAVRMKAALEGARYGEIASLLAAEHDASLRLMPPELARAVGRIAALARECGGAARACGTAKGSLALVWAEPGERTAGPRERVQEALKASAYRSFPCRVDLRGLEVEGA